MRQLLLTFFLTLSALAMAQEKGAVQGMVLDNEVNNEPLSFATVNVKGTPINTTTDLDGIHSLKLNPGTYTLVFNFPGYQKVEVPNILVKENQLTKIQDISLSALRLPFPQDTSEKGETSGLKEK